jgi:hypothetical protein
MKEADRREMKAAINAAPFLRRFKSQILPRKAAPGNMWGSDQ